MVSGHVSKREELDGNMQGNFLLLPCDYGSRGERSEKGGNSGIKFLYS